MTRRTLGLQTVTGCVALLCAATVDADPGATALAAVHRSLAPSLADSPFEVPLLVQATLDGHRVRGDVHAVLAQPFESLERALTSPEAWCDIVTLHFNMKSCRRATPTGFGAQGRVGVPLSIETARKLYISPQGRSRMTYWLDGSGSRPGFLHQTLAAAKGPLGVRDILIEFEAIGLPDGSSFVHLNYAYTAGWAVRLATRTYLATLGRKKVGFTLVGHSPDGEPIYVRGEVGAVERNALRYHLAIAAYLDTLGAAEPDRFEARIARWFDLSERHRRQLFEMPRDEYLEIKRHERRDQEAISAGK